jgi:MOSC domain-containing protein YiiM
MKLVSVNAGLPREVSWHGRMVTTAIFKEPAGGRVALLKLNLDGDRQADLTVHGGEHKAVYCHSLAHYGYWKRELPGRELPIGMFGETLQLKVVLKVVPTPARMDCWKTQSIWAIDSPSVRRKWW